ncbi:hypothetical protein IT072_13795 [Leifsonia sp. ZF2019]|uniref:hypothetical protein n=1 Tax=Leifsonia sp. ZF2019 TaxID=2781978 RepID=UPI001CBCEFA7|nr:hypothetical protein [Leifsonia sp. ZF2019]UAJ78331.1 hypothetical protein IT072_13795 [Leifsonia sp. ZF2019]
MTDTDPLLAAVEARRRRLEESLINVPMPPGQALWSSPQTAAQIAQLDIVIDEIADRVATRLNEPKEIR